MRRVSLLPVLLFVGLSLARASADELELGLTDLTAYRAALQSSDSAPAIPASFRELWDHPERFEGRRIRVEGTLARRFRQGAVGQFPALVEAWVSSRAGDPFCLVYPESADANPAKLGDAIRFEGTFLRRVRYRGSDAARLAPLVVGNHPPSLTKSVSSGASRPFSGDRLWLDGTATLAVLLILAGALVRQQMRKPPSSRPDLEPAPEFLEP